MDEERTRSQRPPQDPIAPQIEEDLAEKILDDLEQLRVAIARLLDERNK